MDDTQIRVISFNQEDEKQKSEAEMKQLQSESQCYLSYIGRLDLMAKELDVTHPLASQLKALRNGLVELLAQSTHRELLILGIIRQGKQNGSTDGQGNQSGTNQAQVAP